MAKALVERFRSEVAETGAGTSAVIHVDSAVASIVPSAVQAVLVHWYSLLSSADSHTHIQMIEEQ
jgi:hypothetical protein